MISVSHRQRQTNDVENRQLSSRLCKWTMALDSSKDEPTIRCEIMKYGYTGVVCAKKPLMIKSDGIQLKYHNGIQLWEYFWD